MLVNFTLTTFFIIKKNVFLTYSVTYPLNKNFYISIRIYNSFIRKSKSQN